ncbi:MAG: SPFH domain-containing protein, partial [Huintestinicola sp.]
LLMDGGKIVDYSAQEGYYEVNNSSAPSLFNGELKESLKDTWQRFQFGGTPSSKQYVYYINTAEIKGIKFGTRNAVQYFDNFYNAELFLRAHGSYSIKITDPIKFFTEFAPKGTDRIMAKDLSSQLFDEFMDALQSAINQMSVDGVRISAINSKSRELSKYMADTLDADWNDLRGIEICSVGIGSISYDEESKNLINLRNKGAMMSDPTIREGFVQTSVAQGLQAAGSNTAGAGNAFMAMGMGMNAAGGFMNTASQTNAMQMQQQAQAQAQAQAAAQQAGGWTCSCGTKNNGNFCNNCGSKKPEAAGSWTCSCGNTNTGNFCNNCGAKRPDAGWTCSCGTANTGNFCNNCGAKRP